MCLFAVHAPTGMSVIEKILDFWIKKSLLYIHERGKGSVAKLACLILGTEKKKVYYTSHKPVYDSAHTYSSRKIGLAFWYGLYKINITYQDISCCQQLSS